MLGVYDLRRLPEEAETIDEPLTPEWLDQNLNDDLEPPELKLVAQAPGRVKLTIERVGGEPDGNPVVRLSGEIHVAFTTPCVRCLNDVAVPVDTQPDVTMFPVGQDRTAEEAPPAKGRPHAELKPEELDEATYAGHEIDLAAFVREAILLEIAMNPSCPDEEACAKRTEQLIHAAGGKGFGEQGDPRWAALREIKNNLLKKTKVSN